MSSSGGGLQPTAILRRPPPGVEPFRVWVPSPVSCPGGATPPPPVDDRSGDLVSGACTGAPPRAHTPCTGRTRLVGRSLFNLCLARQARRPAAHVVLWGRIPRGNGGRVAAVLVVDNAAQPMQAAPVAALKGIAVSGNASKLHVIFTHFDQVKGDNLPGFSDREQHVLASVENVLKSIGDELGPAASASCADGSTRRASSSAVSRIRSTPRRRPARVRSSSSTWP